MKIQTVNITCMGKGWEVFFTIDGVDYFAPEYKHTLSHSEVIKKQKRIMAALNKSKGCADCGSTGHVACFPW